MIKNALLVGVFFLFLPICCVNVDLVERHYFIKNYEWFYSDIASVSFRITDTNTNYKTYLIVRHKNNFNYLNLWLRVNLKHQEDTSTNTSDVNVLLGNNENGWLGSGFYNVFENRFSWTSIRFKKIGVYNFDIEQIMRDNPLKDMISVGVRIEK